jgi:hypothetical protein
MMKIEKLVKGAFVLSTFTWSMVTVFLLIKVLFGLGVL